MKTITLLLGAGALGLALATVPAFAQTDGAAAFQGTILEYDGSTTRHWTVVWVTYENGTFIKSLRKQGPGWTSTHWDSHCRVWNTARGGSASGSQALDGYSSATAPDYTGTNSPVIWTWNCRDANNALVPDGNYKLWFQYAEDSGQGPYTANGLTWTKGPVAATNNYPNMGTNFAGLRLIWTPSTPATVAPTITSSPPAASGTVGVPYQYTCEATGTAPILFSAVGLPPGLSISAAGVITGTPNTAGTFSGSVTAANGTAPDAAQPFAITISLVPVSLTSVQLSGTNLVMSATGPANGVCAILTSTDASQAIEQWSPIITNALTSEGNFSVTLGIDWSVPRRFYRLRIP